MYLPAALLASKVSLLALCVGSLAVAAGPAETAVQWSARPAETAVQWSAEVSNLSYAALSRAQANSLAVGLAADVADALGVKPNDIWDSAGRAGLLTLADAVRTASVATAATTTTPAATTTSSAPKLDENGLPPLQRVRGIAYGALPCTEHDCGGEGRPSEDMLQEGYAEQWGSSGRDDLATMAALGANAVRLYHSMGIKPRDSHAGFLDRAQSVGLNVMAGYHTEAANDPGECPGYDCFDAWKSATLKGFELGFKKGGAWHPAVAALILLNEPDFLEHAPKCQPSGAWCRVKAALSAMDGVLAAEKEAGVKAGCVKLTVTWSFAMMKSIDGKVDGPGVFGFQDMVAGIANASLAHYTPRTHQADLEAAFRTRWVHGLKTQAPWKFVNEMVSKEYARFAPVPWFIGEYGANGQNKPIIHGDLEAMQKHASHSKDFLGAAVFQFQTTYWKGGEEMNFGLFSLGSDQLGETGELCDGQSPCRKWPVHCLGTDLSWLPGSKAKRAEAVAAAWGGRVPHDGQGFCGNAHRRLSGADSDAEGTVVSCQIRRSVVQSESVVMEALGGTAFAERLSKRVGMELGANAAAVHGKLAVGGVSVGLAPSARPSYDEVGQGAKARMQLPAVPGWVWILVGAAAGFLTFGIATAVVLIVLARTFHALKPIKSDARKSSEAKQAKTAEPEPADAVV